MRINTRRLVASLVSLVLLSALSLWFIGQQSKSEPDITKKMYRLVDPANVDVNKLYTYMCEVSVKKPEQLIRTCGDGGMLVYQIKWDTWSPFGATGTGIYSENMCDPSCAEGVRLETPVNVALDTVIKRKGKFYLTNLEVTPVNPDQVPAKLDPVGWDVSEFVIEMDW